MLIAVAFSLPIKILKEKKAPWSHLVLGFFLFFLSVETKKGGVLRAKHVDQHANFLTHALRFKTERF